MNCNPTLTADEFKTVHNAVCELDSVCRQLEDVLNPELYKKLIKARNDIRTGLASAYDQDDRAFSRKSRHYDEAKSELGLKHSEWSIYEVDDMSAAHPYPADSFVEYKDHWGTVPVHCAVEGSTWRDLWRAADACVRLSGDQHHVYIEQFVPDAKDPRMLRLQTGS